MKQDMSVSLGKLKLKNPVMAASGTFGYAEEFADLLDLKKLGAVVSKTVTINPRQGNPAPRTCETPAGMLNSIGLENPGIEAFIEEKLPVLRKSGVPVIVSIASETDPQEFVSLARRLDKLDGIAALELNISCPNLKKNKLVSQDPEATYSLVKAVRKACGKTLITKLSPNVADITEIALAAEKAGSDCLALINTVYGMSIDINKRRPKIAMGTGGLSGPAIKPIAVRMVREVYKKVKTPIIGIGGIMTSEDALEFIIAGASAVSVGTANFVDPGSSSEIIEGLGKYLRANRIKNIKALTGSLKE
ncbi:MAG: dihydroorotate dehydrogenase [Candidatus Omnitrophica bacterium]|jgi:dihydroorotate dehydrogenase (NAD+) catalytic subunit|nr:dihydroorotate dehydrogenase [Candidatus Omnitrophota bacterium]MDD5079996.1 dihydroorotate dehydrogenase [Candidatus Omnitrophota bacterium]